MTEQTRGTDVPTAHDSGAEGASHAQAPAHGAPPAQLGGPGAGATAQAAPVPSDISISPWMWDTEGLGIRGLLDLLVYATIHAATSTGVVFSMTCGELAGMLRYPRESVSRSLARLTDADLIWSPCSRKGAHGGRPVRCYACSTGPRERAIASVAAVSVQGMYAGGGDFGGSFQQSGVPSHNAGETASHWDDPSFQQSSPEGDGPQGLPESSSHSQCDDVAGEECDDCGYTPDAHIAENGPSPARTVVFDTAHIPTCLISNDKNDMLGDSRVDTGAARANDATRQDPVTTDPCPLSEADRAAFDELVRKSLLPVDNAFLAQNLAAFSRIVASGVPAEVILTAYDDYARYQHEQRRKNGEMRPMHLLRWLTQRPNNNIRHVLRRRDERWVADHARDEGWGVRRREPPTHDNPRLTRCIDGKGRHVWYVDDELGGHHILEADGVESPTRVLQLYEAQYRRELKERAERDAAIRRRFRTGP